MTTVPTWDLFIVLFFIIGVGYSYILQRDKVVVTLISVYVALVITPLLVGPVSGFFTGENTMIGKFFINSDISPFTIQAIIFGIIVALVSAKSGISGQESKGIMSSAEIFFYSLMTIALIISSLLYFMPEAQRAGFDEASKIAHYLIKYHTLNIIGPIAVLVFLGYRRNSD